MCTRADLSPSVKRIIDSVSLRLVRELSMVTRDDGLTILEFGTKDVVKLIRARLDELSQSVVPITASSTSGNESSNDAVYRNWEESQESRLTFGGRRLSIGYNVRELFNVMETAMPTSFVILPYKLADLGNGEIGMASPDFAPAAVKFAEYLLNLTDPRSILFYLDLKSRKGHGASLYEGAPDDASLREDAFEKIEEVEDELLKFYEKGKGYFYLIDEQTGEPVLSNSTELYPIVLNEPATFVCSMIQMRGTKALSLLASSILDESITVVPSHWMSSAKNIRGQLFAGQCEDDDLLDRDELKELLFTFISAPSTKQKLEASPRIAADQWNSELSVLKKLFDLHDPDKSYAGLKASSDGMKKVQWSLGSNDEKSPLDSAGSSTSSMNMSNESSRNNVLTASDNDNTTLPHQNTKPSYDSDSFDGLFSDASDASSDHDRMLFHRPEEQSHDTEDMVLSHAKSAESAMKSNCSDADSFSPPSPSSTAGQRGWNQEDVNVHSDQSTSVDTSELNLPSPISAIRAEKSWDQKSTGGSVTSKESGNCASEIKPASSSVQAVRETKQWDQGISTPLPLHSRYNGSVSDDSERESSSALQSPHEHSWGPSSTSGSSLDSSPVHTEAAHSGNGSSDMSLSSKSSVMPSAETKSFQASTEGLPVASSFEGFPAPANPVDQSPHEKKGASTPAEGTGSLTSGSPVSIDHDEATAKYDELFDELSIGPLPDDDFSPKSNTLQVWNSAESVWEEVSHQLEESGTLWDGHKVLELKVKLLQQAKKLALLHNRVKHVSDESERVQVEKSNVLEEAQAQGVRSILDKRKLLLRLCSLEERILCTQIGAQHAAIDSYVLGKSVDELDPPKDALKQDLKEHNQIRDEGKSGPIDVDDEILAKASMLPVVSSKNPETTSSKTNRDAEPIMEVHSTLTPARLSWIESQSDMGIRVDLYTKGNPVLGRRHSSYSSSHASSPSPSEEQGKTFGRNTPPILSTAEDVESPISPPSVATPPQKSTNATVPTVPMSPDEKRSLSTRSGSTHYASLQSPSSRSEMKQQQQQQQLQHQQHCSPPETIDLTDVEEPPFPTHINVPWHQVGQATKVQEQLGLPPSASPTIFRPVSGTTSLGALRFDRSHSYSSYGERSRQSDVSEQSASSFSSASPIERMPSTTSSQVAAKFHNNSSPTSSFTLSGDESHVSRRRTKKTAHQRDQSSILPEMMLASSIADDPVVRELFAMSDRSMASSSAVPNKSQPPFYGEEDDDSDFNKIVAAGTTDALAAIHFDDASSESGNNDYDLDKNNKDSVFSNSSFDELFTRATARQSPATAMMEASNKNMDFAMGELLEM